MWEGWAGFWCSVQGLLRIEGRGDAPREFCCAERHGWSAGGGARHAVGPTGGVRRFRGSATAMRRRVSGTGGAGGKRGSVATMAITVPIRRRRSARGQGGMAPTGGGTVFCTLGTANGTGSSNGSGIGGGVGRLQRWTRQRRVCLWFPGFTGFCREPPGILQRWTRGR
jgi:hypothetical protein